ncbi:cyclic nucleotide-binding domain-containing protein [Pseudaquabacterium pictum]|uniref:Cyclic nucleotide-binding domain-containing protein n=1 Tax=Pseudaquabacterium pictum TaxID=2315236 RepID=A0A480ANR4_9BURK|nr:cyclic nucleotide-binding domain-containing protein [Rubrivivax pictus]GCL61305.1 hypothetical protein AQPW35_03860 [Rubrivivax pictus]
MRLAGRLAAVPVEWRLTGLLFALSFCISGLPRVYTQTAAHTLFIQAYGAQAMPWAYLAEALCVPLAGYAYLRFERVASLRGLLLGTLAAQIVALVLFRVGIAAGWPLVAGASIVYFEIEFVLSSLLLWGLANQLMTLRQGKRLFGYISAGEPVAIILCGVTLPLLLRGLSAADLFLLSAAGAVLGMLLVVHILRHHAPVEEREDAPAASPDANAAPASWWRHRYVLTLVGLVAVGQMAYFFVDSAFYLEAGRRYPDEADMAAFLGLYSAAMGGVSLVCSVLLASWLLRRWGVRAGLLALPGLLALGALGTVAVAAAGGPAEWVFYLVVGNKIIDQAFRYTLDKTTVVTLFQPLPPGQRLRLQAGLESAVEPLAGGVAGLLLFVMMQGLGLGAVGITAVIAAVACTWAGLVAVQYRGYLGALRRALASRALVPQQLVLTDAASQAVLRSALASPRPAEVLYGLTLLDGLGQAPTADEARALLRHPAPEVRLAAAQRLDAARLDLDALQQAVQAERHPPVQAALLAALAAAAPDPVAALGPWLADADPLLRQGAQVALLRHGGGAGQAAVEPALQADLAAADALRRLAAVQVLGQAGALAWAEALAPLVTDPDPAVASATRQALAPLGAAALPVLEPRLRQALADAQPAAVALLQALACPAADQRLLAALLAPATPPALRGLLLQACWQRRLAGTAEQQPALQTAALAEVDAAAAALQAGAVLGGEADPLQQLLQRLLADQVQQHRQALFAWLALLHPGLDLHTAWSHYRHGGPARRAYVIELLDNSLPAPLQRRVLPLLELDDPAQAARALAPAGSTTDPTAALAALARDAHPPVLRATAVWLLARQHGATPELEPETMLTIEKMLALRNVPLFAAVRDGELTAVAASARPVALAAGQTLFAEGDAGDALYVLLQGALAVSVQGRRINTLGDHEVVGEMAVLDPQPRSATVTALETSQLLRIGAAELEALMAADTALARSVIQALCRRLRQRDQRGAVR